MCSGSFKYVIKKIFTNYAYLIYTYKYYLALNNLQVLIWHKNKIKQTFFVHISKQSVGSMVSIISSNNMVSSN